MSRQQLQRPVLKCKNQVWQKPFPEADNEVAIQRLKPIRTVTSSACPREDADMSSVTTTTVTTTTTKTTATVIPTNAGHGDAGLQKRGNKGPASRPGKDPLCHKPKAPQFPACSKIANGYSSACKCLGATTSTTVLPISTTTLTVSTTSTSTLVVTAIQTTVISTTMTTTVRWATHVLNSQLTTYRSLTSRLISLLRQ